MRMKRRQESLSTSNLQTGDLVFSRTGGALGFGVRLFTGGEFDHVSLIYRCKKTGTRYIWEIGSAPSGCGPVITGEGCPPSFAHLVMASKRFNPRKVASAAVRHIRFATTPDGVLRRKQFEEKFEKCMMESLGMPYCGDLVLKWKARTSIVGLGFIDDESKADRWLCPQLVALTLAHASAIIPLIPCEDYMPKDFLEDTTYITETGVSWDELISLSRDDV